MKLGIQTSTFDLRGYGRWGEDTYKKLKQHGYDCTDFDMSNTDTEIYTAEQGKSDELLLREQTSAQQAGIEIFQVHGPWRWPTKDFSAEDRAERMDKMKRSIRATSVLGCKNWVIHPIMPFGTEETGTENAVKTWDMNIDFMNELLKTAREYDVTICLENMPMHKFSMAKPTDILRFVKEINDEHFKICFDTGHVSVFEELAADEELRRLGNEIRALHIHDNRCGYDMHLMPYFGVIDWEAFSRALKDIGFDGCFSLETMPPRNLPDDIFEDMCKVLAKTADYLRKGDVK